MGVFLLQRGSPFVRGLERRSLAAFLAQVRGRVGSDELAISMPCMALRAVFLEPRPAALRMLVSYRTLARDEPQARSQLVWELFEPSHIRRVHRGFGPD